MKALKVLAIVLLATFAYSAVSARPVHHRRHHHRKPHPVAVRHHR